MVQTSAHLVKSPSADSALAPQPVEKVSSVLVTLTIFTGLAVTLLAAILLSQMSHRSAVLAPTSLPGGSGSNGSNGTGLTEFELEAPAPEELKSVQESGMEAMIGFLNTSFPDDIMSIEPSSGSDWTDGRKAGPPGTGRGTGKGRGNGSGDENYFARWQLKFYAKNKAGYAALLDSIGIELAAVGGGIPTIDYASNLKNNPSRRSGKRDDEKRSFYLSVTDSKLSEYDTLLLKAAGVPIENRLILKFVPIELEERLAMVERDYYVKHRNDTFDPTDIASTVFECIIGEDSKIKWSVVSQAYTRFSKR